MFILDTNVVSELMRPAPDPAVASWVAECATSSLFLTAVTEAELRFGLAVMPPGKRRDGLAVGLERMLETGFANRILPFDSSRGARLCRSSPPHGAGSQAVPAAPSRLPDCCDCSARAAWRWRRATFGTSRIWESMYSTHGTPHEQND